MTQFQCLLVTFSDFTLAMATDDQQQDNDTIDISSETHSQSVCLELREPGKELIDVFINELSPRKSKAYSSLVLSSEQRVEYLICGYIRNNFQRDAMPNDVHSLCSQYVGNSSNFDPQHLMTKRESGTNCCGYATFCGKWYRNYRDEIIWKVQKLPSIVVDSARSVTAWQWVIAIILVIKLGIDGAALHAAVVHDHTYAIDEADRLVEVDEMLHVGAITDMMICVLSVLVTYVAGENIGIWLYPESRFALDVDEEGDDDCCERCCSKPMMETACCLELLLLTFNTLWTVFGVILWTEMDPQHPSTSIVLIWCIIQGTFGVLAPCCVRAVYRSRAVFDVLYIWKRFVKALPKVDNYMKGVVLVMVIKFAKDMAALVIAFSVDCHEEVDEEVINSLDVNSWLFVGGFTDLMISCIMALKTLSSDAFCASLYMGMDPMTCCLLMVIMSFDTIWTVFGFMFWAEMETSTVCSDMVLSWCIIEGAVGVLVQCCAYLCFRACFVWDVISNSSRS